MGVARAIDFWFGDERLFVAVADLGDRRLDPELFFVLTVKTDAVAIAAIEIEQCAVERATGGRFDDHFNLFEQRRPWLRLVGEAGVGVGHTGIAVPGRQSRLYVTAPLDDDVLVLPFDLRDPDRKS